MKAIILNMSDLNRKAHKMCIASLELKEVTEVGKD